jgi:hypothetical protein
MKRNTLASLASAAVIAVTMGMASPAAEAKVVINIGIDGIFGWHTWHGRHCGWRNHHVKVWSKRHHRRVWVWSKRRHCW